MTFLLGPATVAHALPLYKNRQVFFKNIVAAGCGLLAGSLGTMIIAGLTARMLGFPPVLTSSIAIKSTTVPIPVEIAKIVHGAAALTAIFVVITGMLGEPRPLADEPGRHNPSGFPRVGPRDDLAPARHRRGGRRRPAVWCRGGRCNGISGRSALL